MNAIVENLIQTLQERLPVFLMAAGVLVAGWLVALLVSLVVRFLLKRTEFDNRLAAWLMGTDASEEIEIEKWISRAVFWIGMLFVFVGFFHVLGLTVITQPLMSFLDRIFEYLPRLIGPVLLLVVAWMVATGLRFAVRKVLTIARIDQRLGENMGEEGTSVSLARTLSEAVYWMIFLLFLPAILGALNLEGLLRPVQGMIDEFLSFLPNLLAAFVILAVGWLLARVVQRIVSNLLAAIGADRLSEQIGLGKALGAQPLSKVLGLLLYVLILIPVLIAALNALHLDAVTRPASEMLSTILAALPLLFGAALLLIIAYFVGRVVSGLIANLLTGFGFDAMLTRIGIGSQDEESSIQASTVVANLTLIAIMMFASIEAVRMLGFEVLALLITDFMTFAGHVLLGLVIFGIGLYLSKLAATTIETSSSPQAPLLAVSARGSVLVLAGAMALRQMGLANEIITLAFGLLLGAVAVAVALAFGIGGRDLAAEALKEWTGRK